ncbi:MAG: adenylate/guanylate cyclase domain-containing protein [Leptospiraceae bacterium]|nr:adenylate/guanylate cyclase domain-containing protein [Leptospiraceae bacterium]
MHSSRLLSQVKDEKTAAEKARSESDRLLETVLPKKTAAELKHNGFVIPRFYESVSVLFTDFVGYTESSALMKPEKLVKELDGCFTQFDEIVIRHGLEKLKTIGDSYMCAGGLPKQNESHAIDACLAAITIRSFIQQLRSLRYEQNEDFWSIRIGIHSGPVTAGVIGTHKFSYDIWGDTVNTASRMESHSQPDQINVSYSTYSLTQDLFEFENRGQIFVKSKGPMQMNYLKRIKSKYSVDENGFIPNGKFEALRAGLSMTETKS